MHIDYYNNHYKHVNKNIDLVSYKKVIINDYGKLLNDKNKIILDLGCGTGFFLQTLGDLGFTNLYGVDSDKNQINEAKHKLKDIKLFNCDANYFFQNNTNIKYDIIFANDLVEHINKEEIIPLLENIFKSLDNNGLLVIKTPNADSPFFSGKMRYIDFTHTISFNTISIKMVLRAAGFQKIKCKKTNTIFLSVLGKILTTPIRLFLDTFLRIYLFTYISTDAFKTILTPNFITIAKK